MSAATRSATAYSAARGQRPRPADAYRDGRRSLQLHLDYGIVPARQAAGLLARRWPRPRGDPYSFENHGREIVSMKKMLALSAALAAAVSVAACQTPQQQNALAGGALGAGTGALIGSAVTHGSAGGALAGAAIGAGTGALFGAAATPPYYGGLALPPYHRSGREVGLSSRGRR